jgi:YceI-like domain
MPRSLSTAALAALALAAAAAHADDAPRVLALKEATLGYALVHPMHKVSATCRTAEGAAKVNPGGPVQVQVRAKVACFDSGDANRDVHMREVTHEPLHPLVSLKGTLEGLQLPLAEKGTRTLAAKVELNGEVQQVSVPVEVSSEGGKVRAKFSFPVSLEGFKIERPSLLLVKVEDALTISGELLFE